MGAEAGEGGRSGGGGDAHRAAMGAEGPAAAAGTLETAETPATTAAPLETTEGGDRSLGGGGDRRLVVARMAAEVAASAAVAEAADAVAEAAAEVAQVAVKAASSAAAAADAAASAAKLAAETAREAASEAMKASASAAAARAAASDVTKKTTSLLKALELETSSAVSLLDATLTLPNQCSYDYPLYIGPTELPPFMVIEENHHMGAVGKDNPSVTTTLEQKITDVKELLATGLLEGETILYQQKTKEKKILEGRIVGVHYTCSCHNKSMSAKQFEMHAECKSSNPNDHIFCWGQSLYSIIHQLKTMPIEDQFLAVLRMKKEDRGSKSSRDEI